MTEFMFGFGVGSLSVLLIFVAKYITEKPEEQGLSKEFMSMINDSYDLEYEFKPEGTE